MPFNRVTLCMLLIATIASASEVAAQDRSASLAKLVRDPTIEVAVVDEFLQRAVASDCLPRDIDAVTVLLLAHEPIVLPRIMFRLRAALRDPAKPGRIVVALEEIVSYAATTAATEALLDLERNYPIRVERLIPKHLSSAVGRRNPFEVAYQVLDKGGVYSRRAAGQWVDDRLSNNRHFAEFAEAFVNRHGAAYAAALAADPLTSRLDGRQYSELRVSIEAEVRRRKAGPVR